MIIEFRTNSTSKVWMPWHLPMPDDPRAFVADRNRHHGWQKYRIKKEGS